MRDLGIILNYFDYSKDPNLSYPYSIDVDCDITANLRLVITEFIALCTLVRENFKSADYLIDTDIRIIDFRHKSDAMRLKLMWRPIS